jgi:hypothetical protein
VEKNSKPILCWTGIPKLTVTFCTNATFPAASGLDQSSKPRCKSTEEKNIRLEESLLCGYVNFVVFLAKTPHICGNMF